ncbi:MAG: LPS export ABC transporter permease LptG [Alphaproteobacteria bacterium]
MSALAAPMRKTRLSAIMFFYIGRQFILWFLAVTLLFVALIFMIDMIELLRRSSGKPAVTFDLVLTMAAMKLPLLTQVTMPFAILFAGMMSFWRLNRSSELVSIRAAGVSIWQILAPALIIALLIGVFRLAALNPVASDMYARWQQLESRYLKGGRSSIMALSKTGIWLRQIDDGEQTVIHAAAVSPDKLLLHRVMVLLYKGKDRFSRRIDAKTAVLKKGYWELRDVSLFSLETGTTKMAVYRLKTDLTLNKIQESFSSPETISFWELPRFIRELEAAGFSALRHTVRFHALTAEPLLFCSMILIAAVFSLRHNRKTTAYFAIGGGIITGFLLFFVTKLVLNFGGSGSLPVVLAAWIPTGASAMLGFTVLLHLEDG